MAFLASILAFVMFAPGGGQSKALDSVKWHYLNVSDNSPGPTKAQVTEAQRLMSLGRHVRPFILAPCCFALASAGIDAETNTKRMTATALRSGYASEDSTSLIEALPEALRWLILKRHSRAACRALIALDLDGAAGEIAADCQGEVALADLTTVAMEWSHLSARHRVALVNGLLFECEDPTFRRRIRRGLQAKSASVRTLCKQVLHEWVKEQRKDY